MPTGIPRTSGVHWQTETIGHYCKRISDSAPTVAHALTDALGDSLLKRIRDRTPIGTQQEAFNGGSFPPGTLRDSLHRSDKKEGSFDPIAEFRDVLHDLGLHHEFAISKTYEVTVETDVKYAPFVEYNTGKYRKGGHAYKIESKSGKALAFMGRNGKMVIIKWVMHPGSKGHHMFRDGAASLTARQITLETKAIVDEWRDYFKIVEPKGSVL